MSKEIKQEENLKLITNIYPDTKPHVGPPHRQRKDKK